MRRPGIQTLGLCIGAAAVLAGAALNPRDLVLYNASPSVPVGFYVRTAAPVRTGAFVTVRARDVAPAYAARREFTGPRDRFIKRVAARAGVRVCAAGRTVQVGDRPYARLVHDQAGRTLPAFEGCRTLKPGEAFLMGDTRDSFDSRYFGIVPESAVEGVWRPLRIP